jgi:outer membrane protein
MNDWSRVGVRSAVVAAVLFSASFAHAQTRLTLEEALSRGIAQAPRLAEARARRAAADAGIVAREAQSGPMLTASSGYLRTNHVDEFGIRQPDGSLRVLFPDIPSNYRARAEFGMPIYTSGRVRAAVDAARADAEAAAADERTVRADIELDVATAYWTLVTTRARVTVLERALARSDQFVTDIGARVDAGLLPPNDRLTAQAQRARQRVQLIQSQNEAALAEASLARLVGVAPGERLEPATPVTVPTPRADAAATRDAAAVAGEVTNGRSERQAITFRVQALREAAHALSANTRPQVSLIAAVEPSRPNARFVPRVNEWNTSWDLGVNVTWTLWDNGRSRADRVVMNLQADALVARLTDVDSAVALEIRQRQLDMSSARAALLAVAEAVEAATEARRVVGERFNAGVTVGSDVLDSDVALLEAELERTRLEASLRVSEARLLRALGGR